MNSYRGSLIILLLIALTLPLYAESFIVKSYDINITVNENRVADISETLDLYFTSPSHGLYRDIQDTFPSPFSRWNKIEAKVSNIRATELIGVSEEGDFTILKLGNPNRLTSGDKRYELSYSFDLGGDYYKDFDEFYYNIVSASWDTEIRETAFSITFPKALDRERIHITYGEGGSTKELPFTLSGDNKTISGIAPRLSPKEAITLRVEMDDGYFSEQIDLTKGLYLYPILSLLIFILIFIAALLLWSRYGKDEILIIVPEFKPPKDISPLDAGYIYDGRLSEKEISAMIFFFADQGYLTITKVTKKKKSKVVLERIRALPRNANLADRLLFNALFKTGDVVTIDDIRSSNFASSTEKIFAAERAAFTKERSLNDKKASSIKRMLIALTYIASIFSLFLLSLRFSDLIVALAIPTIVFISLVLSIAITFEKTYKAKTTLKKALAISGVAILSLIYAFVLLAALIDVIPAMPLLVIYCTLTPLLIAATTFVAALTEKRSAYAKRVTEELLGFKEFIEKAEMAELRLLIEEDPTYYYHTLSYAIVLGLETKWSSKFEAIMTAPPAWYRSDTNDLFTILILNNIARSWRTEYRTMLHQAKSPASGHISSGSSFSGFSGFSGGGFSGGGGRSW